jgi:Arc/MetJ-type ribon-helix-helix transcriptional regulator
MKKESGNEKKKESEDSKVGILCACPEDLSSIQNIQQVAHSIRDILKERGNVIMTRLSDEDLEEIDALVEVELFKSRSEAVAYFIHEGIKARKDLFEKVKPTVDKIRQLKKEARETLEKPKQGGEKQT